MQNRNFFSRIRESNILKFSNNSFIWRGRKKKGKTGHAPVKSIFWNSVFEAGVVRMPSLTGYLCKELYLI